MVGTILFKAVFDLESVINLYINHRINLLDLSDGNLFTSVYRLEEYDGLRSAHTLQGGGRFLSANQNFTVIIVNEYGFTSYFICFFIFRVSL